MKITDLERLLSELPDLTDLRFTLNGRPIVLVGAIKEISYNIERGNLTPVTEVLNLEFE